MKKKKVFQLQGGFLKSKFIFKDNVDIFLTGEEFKDNWDYNLKIYKGINLFTFSKLDINQFPKNSIEFKKFGIYNHLHYFNNLYAQLDIVLNHRDQPSNVIKHLMSLEMILITKYIFLTDILQFRNFKIKASDGFITDLDKCISQLEIIYKLLQDECIEIDKELKAFKDQFFLSFEKDVLPKLKSKKSPEEKISFLLETINRCKHEMLTQPGKYEQIGKITIERCEQEITNIKRQVEEGLSNEVMSKPKRIDASLTGRAKDKVSGALEIESNLDQLPLSNSNKNLNEHSINPGYILLPENNAPKKVMKKKKADLTFSEIFRDKTKANKLIEELKKKQIIDNSHNWLLGETTIIILIKELIEGHNLLKKIKVAALARTLCKEFGLWPIPFHICMLYQHESENNFHEEFSQIVANL